MRTWPLVLCLLMLTAIAVAADEAAAPKTYTVQLDDTLENAIKQLKQDYDINLSADQVLLSTRVVVNLEDATFMQLLEAICRQVGAVYEPPFQPMPGAQAFWRLREGDWDLDCRPRVEVAGVLVAVENVNVQYNYVRRFAWGMDESQASETATLNIMVRAIPQSPEMLGRVGGVLISRAVLDTGETLEPPGNAQLQAHMRRMLAFSGGLINASLPAPPQNATAITELHGEVAVMRQSPLGTVEFKPNEVGRTLPLASAQCTLRTWAGGEGTVTVTLEVSWGTDEAAMQMMQSAELHGPAGQKATATSTSVNQTGKSSVYTLTFPGVNFEPTKLVFTALVPGGPSDTHPFVITDIPLP